MDRIEFVEKLKNTVCKDRNEQYGSPEDSFSEIARAWSWYLDKELTTEDVAVLMILFKSARVKTGRFKSDNYLDIAGYACCAEEIGSMKKKIPTVDDLAKMVESKPEFEVGDKVTMQLWDEKVRKKYGRYCFTEIREIDHVDPNGWCTVEGMTYNYDLDDLVKWRKK